MIKLAIVVAVSSISLIGAQEQPKPESTTAPQTITLPAGHPPIKAGQTVPKVDAHANMKAATLPDNVPTTKATVLQTIDADVYTYIEAKAADNKTIWLALPKVTVSKGTTIEYPTKAFAVTNFTSKTLKKTFDNILFVEGIRIVN
ncbi:hypothetical protein FY034_10425 [Trichlorobacter lovleyi]|uniref:hypothetical protein n=1 Tax=Trichlorobacter lovleyi TaxID=313985 RepID=UPI00223FE24C|nr:hypothetical protein [Trichlorobacter lovleyi]QOX79329.1 hypothetical protein FY034_10425 [Trichlorobacter lovleyi]